MKAITETLDVSRSRQYEKKEKPIRRRGRYKAKEEDMAFLPVIWEVISDRPTYGYRRITAIVNRTLRAKGETPINHKRMYRIMKANDLCSLPSTPVGLCTATRVRL
jgi:putative transposase